MDEHRPILQFNNRLYRLICPGLFVLLVACILVGPTVSKAQDSPSAGLVSILSTQFNIPFLTSSYMVSSADNMLLPGHLYCKSPGTSVGINTTVFGNGNIISPPYFCYPFSSQFSLFNQPVSVADFDWYPSGVQLKGKELNGVTSELTITPLWNSKGIVTRIELKNTLDHEIEIPAEWQFTGQVGASINWEWYPPFAMKSNPADIHLKVNNESVEIRNDSTVVIIKSPEFKPKADKSNILESRIVLQPNETKSFSLVILMGTNSNKLNKEADLILQNPEKTRKDAFAKGEGALERLESKVPKLEGCSSELNLFYKKGLLSFSTCRWEVPEFITSPWYAESGMDGGALNNYCWGVAYISRLMSMIDPSSVRKLLVAYARADLQKAYALNPATGKGMGVLYSYNYYSIARATHDYITLTGDLSLLDEQIGVESYLEYLYRFCLSGEDLNTDPDLIDFGGNQNLLELKKTTAYSHFTPSPNAERLLIYRYLTDFYTWTGKPIPNDLTQRGEKLKNVFRSRLWDAEKNWLYCLDAEGLHRTAYSIQIFDVLRTGALNNEQQKAIVLHLNTREFLTPWGVHSLAITDEGYDPTDVDWGGPGVYAGDAPELVEDLLNAGFVNQGVDLLQRILWWGQFPYYPQAIRADRKGHREDGRPNEIAGLATTQSVIFGLFGITVGKDYLSVKPVNHPFMKGISLKGLTIRNQKIDVSIPTGKSGFSVSVGGKSIQSSTGKAIIIKLPDLSGN